MLRKIETVPYTKEIEYDGPFIVKLWRMLFKPKPTATAWDGDSRYWSDGRIEFSKYRVTIPNADTILYLNGLRLHPADYSLVTIHGGFVAVIEGPIWSGDVIVAECLQVL